MKKTIRKFGLSVITCSMLVCYMSCNSLDAPTIGNETTTEIPNGENDGGSSGGTAADDESDTTPVEFKAGWYCYEVDGTYVYIQYDENKNVKKILHVNGEILGDEFNTEKADYNFDSIGGKLKYITDIHKLPPYYFKACTTISAKLDTGFYKGVSVTTQIKPSINDGEIKYAAVSGGSITIVPKYYDADGNEAMTSVVPNLCCKITSLSGDNIDFKKYFIMNTDENNNYVIKYYNKIEEATSFSVVIYDQAHGIDASEDKKITFIIDALAL